MKRGIWVGKILVWIIVLIGITFGFGMGTMYLWNWLVPELFSGPVITFWQAIGLLVLSKILFWGFGRGCHCGNRHGGPWRPYWKEKWASMNPEDRERFKQKLKDKWCYTGPTTPDANSGSSTV
jgi:hypothetical protein